MIISIIVINSFTIYCGALFSVSPNPMYTLAIVVVDWLVCSDPSSYRLYISGFQSCCSYIHVTLHCIALKKTCTQCGTQSFLRCLRCEFCKREFPKRPPKPVKHVKHAYKVWACLRQKVHVCMLSLAFMCVYI